MQAICNPAHPAEWQLNDSSHSQAVCTACLPQFLSKCPLHQLQHLSSGQPFTLLRTSDPSHIREFVRRNTEAIMQEIGASLQQFYNSAKDPKVEMERLKEEFLSQEQGLKSGFEYLQLALEEEVVDSSTVERLEAEPEVGCAAREVMLAGVNMNPEHAKETVRTAIQVLAERTESTSLVLRTIKGLSESQTGASEVRKLLSFCQANGESGLDACSEALQTVGIPFQLACSCQVRLIETYTGTDLQTCLQGLTVMVRGSDARQSGKLVQVVHNAIENQALPAVIRASVQLQENSYTNAPQFCRRLLKHPIPQARDEFLTAFFASNSPHTRTYLCNYVTTQPKTERYTITPFSRACACFRISRIYESAENAAGWSQALSVFCESPLPFDQVQTSLSRIETTLATLSVLIVPYVDNEVCILKALANHSEIGDIANLVSLVPYLSLAAVQLLLPRLKEADILLETLLSLGQNEAIQGLLSGLIENHLSYLLEELNEQRLYISLAVVAVMQQQWGKLGALAEVSTAEFIGKLGPRAMDILSILIAISPLLEEKELYAYGDLLLTASSEWLDLLICLISERRDAWLLQLLRIHKALGLVPEAMSITRAGISLAARGVQVKDLMEKANAMVARPALRPAVCGLFEEIGKGGDAEALDWYFGLLAVSTVDHSDLVLALGLILPKLTNFRTFQPLISALLTSPSAVQVVAQLSTLPNPALVFSLLQEKLVRGEMIEKALNILVALLQSLQARENAEAVFTAIVTDTSDAFLDKLGSLLAAQDLWTCVVPLPNEIFTLILTAALNMPDQLLDLQVLAQLSTLPATIEPAIQMLRDNPAETSAFLALVNELRRHPPIVQLLLSLISPNSLKTLSFLANFAACLPEKCDLTHFLAFSATLAETEVNAEDAELLLACRDDPPAVLRALKEGPVLADLMGKLYTPSACPLCHTRIRASKEKNLSCPCLFHSECIRSHLQGLLPTLEYFCPQCQIGIDRALLQDLLGMEIYILWEKLQDGLPCPACNKRNPRKELEMTSSAHITCIHCSKNYCGVCSSDWADSHSPEACREAQIQAACALFDEVGSPWAQCPGCRRPALQEGDNNAVECLYCYTRWCFDCCALMLPILAHDNSWHRQNCKFHLPPGTKEDVMKEKCPLCQKLGKRCDPPNVLRIPRRVGADEVE